jgi:hypothetical protein
MKMAMPAPFIIFIYTIIGFRTIICNLTGDGEQYTHFCRDCLQWQCRRAAGTFFAEVVNLN